MFLSRTWGINRPLKVILFFLSTTPIFFYSSCKDDPEPPIEISFSADVQSIVEGNQVDIFIPLERAATTSGKVVVQLSGSAIYNEDYNTDPSGEMGSFELIIAAGATSVRLSVATINDIIFKGDRPIVITISDPSEGFTLGSRKSLTLTILDDESQAAANFQTSVASVIENSVTGITLQIPFSMATQGPGTITVSWASNNGAYNTHFTTLPAAIGNTITLSVPGDATGTSLTLIPKDDSYFHDNYVVAFEITSTTGSVKMGTTNKLTVTLQEDESPSFASFTGTDSVIPETQTSGIIVPLALSIPASESGTITVSFTSTSATYGSHFTTVPAASGTNIVLNVAKNDIASQLTIIPIDNSTDNEDQIILFTISNGTGVVRPAGSIIYVLTIKDNEPSLRTVRISFGMSSAPLVTGFGIWNHAYTDSPEAGTTWTNLVRSDGVVTNLGLRIDSYLTPQPHGKTTGINSGVFPDNALKGYWYVPGPNQGITRGFSIIFLDNNVQYMFKIHGGTTVTSSDGRNTMTISVDGEEKSLFDVTNNTSQFLFWQNKTPISATIAVNLIDTDGGGICPINAMEISWYED